MMTDKQMHSYVFYLKLNADRTIDSTMVTVNCDYVKKLKLKELASKFKLLHSVSLKECDTFPEIPGTWKPRIIMTIIIFAMY